MKSYHLIISGGVQGVGFRRFVAYHARKKNITGWVKNLPDKTVEACFVGDDAQLQKMITICKKGPEISLVENIDIKEIPVGDFPSFTIIK